MGRPRGRKEPECGVRRRSERSRFVPRRLETFPIRTRSAGVKAADSGIHPTAQMNSSGGERRLPRGRPRQRRRPPRGYSDTAVADFVVRGYSDAVVAEVVVTGGTFWMSRT